MKWVVMLLVLVVTGCITTPSNKRPCTTEERQMMENVSSKFAVVNPSIRAICK